MVAKKRRIPVVIDTNVFVRAFLSRSKRSPNQRLVRLWLLARQLQLIVSAEIIAEYLDIFDRVLDLEPALVENWRLRFEDDKRTTVVALTKRFHASRDPDDNLMLATAYAGKAEYLITNDNDLLDLAGDDQATLPFVIVRPSEFFSSWK